MRILKSDESRFALAPEPEEVSLDACPSEVLICDRRKSRFDLIKRIASECGAQSRPGAEDSTFSKPTPLTQFSCALVALDDCPAPDSPVLDTVRALVRGGVVVVCYADHTETWPLGRRCNVLLAGALTLFDSSKAEFDLDLKRTVVELLRWRRVRGNELESTKREMREVGIIGESNVMLAIFDWLKRVSALSDLPALITGETGTGKELIVNAIYRLDPKRSRGPFVVLNCGAIGAGVAESELFGHCRGAFTGADHRRRGLIRTANGGILFLDEIGELDFALQAKLLRVLQENRVLSVGEDQEVPVNVRVIAATNRNLPEMVRNGTFRPDLFHRLNILSIEVPPLRLRRADLKPLVEYFVEKHSPLSQVKSIQIDPEFIEALAQLELTGNARELENLVRRVLVNKSTDGPLQLSDLPSEVLGEIAEKKAERAIQTATTRELPDRGDLDVSLPQLLRMNDGSLVRTLEHCERVLIASALEDSHGNRSRVAKQLGITSRSVYNKLRKYHLT